jgi:hypothetical protein
MSLILPGNNSAYCACNHCAETIAFDPAWAGGKTICPHCGRETVLFIPESGGGTGAPEASRQRRPTGNDDAAPLVRFEQVFVCVFYAVASLLAISFIAGLLAELVRIVLTGNL